MWPWCCAALSGLLLALCLPRWDQTWLCWFALTPLIYAVWFSSAPSRQRKKWKRDALLGYVAGLVFFSVAFGWLATLATLMENPWLLALPFLLALYMALYFAFWAWFVGLIPRGDLLFLTSRRNLWIAALGASAWSAHEWVRGWFLSGWGWNNLGTALHGKQIAMAQIAEWTGVAGPSFLIAFANLIAVVTVRRFISEIRRARLRPHWDFNLTMLLLGLTLLHGGRILLRKENLGDFVPLRVAAVQANIPQNEKFDEEFEQHIFDHYRWLTKTALPLNPQLVIWPEAATPRGIFADEINHRFVLDIAAQGDFNFLLGSIDSDLQEHDFNIAAMLTDGGSHIQVYHKMHLVPFGEFIPFRNSFPLFAKVAGDMVPGDFTPGREFTIFETKNPSLKIAPLICFEDTLGNLTRQFVLRGAQLLVNVTNDGWFLHSPATEQHLVNAVFRAIETRRPLVRAANTGVTCFVDTTGRVTRELRDPKNGPFLTGVLSGVVNVPTHGEITFYTTHGEIFAMICAAITCVYLLARLRFR